MKALKGSVVIRPIKGGLTVRWRVNGKREEIFISGGDPHSRLIALNIQDTVKRDLAGGSYDTTALKYKSLVKDHGLIAQRPGARNKSEEPTSNFDLIAEFTYYIKVVKGHSAEIPNYYRHTLNMLRSWGGLQPEAVPKKLIQMRYNNETFNSRRNCLSRFFQWCIRKKKLMENPLEEVKSKKTGQNNTTRKPFTDGEARRILDALKNNSYSSSVAYPHSQYYSFVAFLIHVGVRNAEGVGLLVTDCNFDSRELSIGRAFARTQKGTNVGARVMKGTKNENVRFIPMDQYLYDLLYPLCQNKKSSDFVFTNKKGNPIDDRMFQRRIWKPLLKTMQIDERDLYACRHTFATRAVRQGMKPHEVAYIMGSSLKIVLQRYYHNNLSPVDLPSPLSVVKDKSKLQVIRGGGFFTENI